jgi:galactose oxidase-like protein
MSRLFGRHVVTLSAVAAVTLGMIGTLVPGQAATTALNWVQVSSAQAPPGRQLAVMSYDSIRGRTVLFGGSAAQIGSTQPQPPNLADTWEWDGTSWIQRSPAASPPGLVAAAMAYDSRRGVSVLFGGATTSGAGTADTWEWDGNAWAQRALAAAPSARVWHAMAYDSARGRVVLFGGNGSAGARLADTWEFDGTTWIQRFPATSPPSRFGATMAFDSIRNRIVLFGGLGDSGRLNDTWEWDGSNWVRRSSSSSPYPRAFTSMAFDSQLGKTILFGGDHIRPFALGGVNDTWEWDGSQWTRDWTAAAPGARLGEALVYDSARGRSVVFGGTYGSRPQIFPNDTWELGTGITTPAGNPDVNVTQVSGFDYTNVGTTSPAAGVSLSSSGSGPLLISSMSISGDFAISGTDCPIAPNPLAAGSICVVFVTFTPTATGDRSGSLVLADNGPGGALAIPLAGIGTAAPTTLTVNPATASYGGTTTITASLAAKGSPVAGATVTFTLANGASASLQTDSQGIASWAAASTIGLHAGLYPNGIQASFAGDQAHLASSGSAALAVSQSGSIAYSGDLYIVDTSSVDLSVVVDQRSAASDPQFIDYSLQPVWVRFDVVGPGGLTTIEGQVTDSADWASTGQGVASASVPAMPDGAYTVIAQLVSPYDAAAPSPFITADDIRVALTSSPVKAGFLSGAGAIAADPSATAGDMQGYFGLQLKPGRVIQGNLIYSYRTRMDVGSGAIRDVDVWITSNDVTSLVGNQSVATATGHFSVAFIDARSGARYSSFEFSGTFKVVVVDGGTKSSDTFAITFRRPDGTLFHASAPVNTGGDARPVPVVIGNVVSHL